MLTSPPPVRDLSPRLAVRWPRLCALSCASVTLAHLKSLCSSHLLPWVSSSPQGPSPHPVPSLVRPIRSSGRCFSPGPGGRSPSCSSRPGQRVCLPVQTGTWGSRDELCLVLPRCRDYRGLDKEICAGMIGCSRIWVSRNGTVELFQG